MKPRPQNQMKPTNANSVTQLSAFSLLGCASNVAKIPAKTLGTDRSFQTELRIVFRVSGTTMEPCALQVEVDSTSTSTFGFSFSLKHLYKTVNCTLWISSLLIWVRQHYRKKTQVISAPPTPEKKRLLCSGSYDNLRCVFRISLGSSRLDLHEIYIFVGDLYLSYIHQNTILPFNGYVDLKVTTGIGLTGTIYQQTFNPWECSHDEGYHKSDAWLMYCVIFIDGFHRFKYLSMFSIELLGVKTNPAKSARNLGVIFDENFTFRSHISAVCNSCFYHMGNLRRIHRHLDLDSAKLLATALVSSRLDYCNSLLYGIADIDLTRLQCVQNQLAHLVTKSPPFTSSLPLLRSLHRLPVRFRILFKINLLTYKTLREKQPVYLHSMLATSIPSCSLRSNNDNGLSVPRVKTNTGAGAFHSLLVQRPTVCPFSRYLQEISEDTSLWFGLSTIDTVTPHGLLMLRNCFLDFAVEHWFGWFGCCATEPGFAGDIGAIEVWLIDL